MQLRLRIIPVAVGLLLVAACQTVRAQTITPPVMPSIKVDGRESNLVTLQQLDVQVRIYGTVATTTWTMTFRNSTNRLLEGELSFPLAEGITVDRYALDINGRLREAVPVEKEKATQVFESIERRRVDPGLLEKVQGNGFRTRIYPIPANGTRTVLIGYEEELLSGSSSNLHWRLPMAFTYPLEVFNLSIQVYRGTVKPVIEDNIDPSLQFGSWEDNWSAKKRFTNFKADRTLTISIPRARDEQDVLMQQAGNHYIYLLGVFPPPKKIEKQGPRYITIFWDASLSGLTRDHEKELKLLDAYINTLKNVEVELVRFRHTAADPIHFNVLGGKWQTLKDTLTHTVYDGATQFGVLNPGKYNGEEYLLFSDGRSNYGSDRMPPIPNPLYCIVATANADHPFLRGLAEISGGDVINLETSNIEEAKVRLTHQRLNFMGIKLDAALDESYPTRMAPVEGAVSVAGICYNPQQEVTLRFGFGGRVVSETKVHLDFTKHKTRELDLSKILAHKKLAELDRRYEDNKLEIRELGRRYGLVTRGTSLIVLESVEDYVRYNIEPPAELREAYDRIIKTRGQTERRQQEMTRDRAADMFNELLAWWKTDFKPGKYLPPDKNEEDSNNSAAPARAFDSDGSRAVQSEVLASRASGQTDHMEATGSFAKDKKAGAPNNDPETTGSFHAFKQEVQTAYLTRLNKASPSNRYLIYLEERKVQLHTPVFYFNTANFFLEKGEKKLGLQILSNIAELDVESYELYKMLGYALRRLEETTAACEVFEKVLEWRPFEPQSYRDYALALRDAGHYQRALDTLYAALVKNYSADIEAQYPGIEEVILPEINNIIALDGNKVNPARIPRRLITNLPVDIRVVLNWNMNDTDIDLWVTDPNGEKCYYSHKRTAAGGRISSDFTRGLGPEQFMLKKAIKGKYRVEVNYYGDTRTKLAGPTTILAEIYTHYGTDQETRMLIPLQMQAASDRTVLVGEFDFQ